VPLHLTKVAFGCDSLPTLQSRIAARAEGESVVLTTRYLPKRHAEIAGGSLYWIVKHQLVARCPILRFGEAEGGRVAIHLRPTLVLVRAAPKRAHQGWRYLEHGDAPADLGAADAGIADMPPVLVGKLTELALL
jgi:hypothetical protein